MPADRSISAPAGARRLPAEWEQHSAVWISWPHNASDWPGKFEPIRWTYAEIVRALSRSERVEILCHDASIAAEAKHCLDRHMVQDTGYRLHLCPTNRSWLRDSAPTGVITGGTLQWLAWKFNAWAKYDDFNLDAGVPARISQVSGLECAPAARPDDTAKPFVLEGGAFDTDGLGTLLVTEECLLSEAQCRNPGMARADYEAAFQEHLGITHTLWLPAGISGDDTHGHIDDVARFTGPATVLLAYEEDPADENHRIAVENMRYLASAKDATGQLLEVVKLPMPSPVIFDGQRLPASYANFYIANKEVLVPTFNDRNDRIALNIIAGLFPKRTVVGIPALDLVLGLGTLHCLTQQQPNPAPQE